MPLRDHLSPYCSELTVLYVEDDGPSRVAMAARMRGLFKEVLQARDGREGLAVWRSKAPDIILTDHHMPGMTGLEMAAEIRKVGSKVPIIFITESMNNALLGQVIGLGIASILPKPVVVENLVQAFSLVVGMLEHDHLQRRTMEQDMALLQLRERYHENQQEMAFRKELSILENDFLGRSFSGPPGRGEWIAEVAYLPKDIMCGDSYSLRRLPDGSMLVFLADAMGKGLSAALTTSLAVYTFNLQVDRLAPGSLFSLGDFVREFITMIGRRLLEDEVLSLALVWLPCKRALLEVASFGMPPMLLEGGDGPCKLPCNNPPLSPYTTDFSTRAHDLGDARRILLYTDGLNEAGTSEGGLYRSHLEPDFRERAGRAAFLEAFRKQVPVPEDDVTLLFLTRVDPEPLWQRRMTVESRLERVEEACQELDHCLETRTRLAAEPRYEFSVAIREALLNAYEHGSLGIHNRLKSELLESGLYFDHLLEREASPHPPVTVDLALTEDGGNRLLAVTIQDEGPGFATSKARFETLDSLLLHGRGLRMIRKYTDAFYYNEQGNTLTLLKFYRE